MNITEQTTYCIVCRDPIPIERAVKKSNTCKKEHAAELKKLRRALIDNRRCRHCHKPSTPEDRQRFQKWARDTGNLKAKGRPKGSTKQVAVEVGHLTRRLPMLSENCVACGEPMPPIESHCAEIMDVTTGARRHPPCEHRPLPYKVFKMNDCDWMAAATIEEATNEYKQNYSGDEYEEEEEPRELSDEEMSRLIFTDAEKEPILKITFRQQLERMIVNGEKFPAFFASTEF